MRFKRKSQPIRGYSRNWFGAWSNSVPWSWSNSWSYSWPWSEAWYSPLAKSWSRAWFMSRF